MTLTRNTCNKINKIYQKITLLNYLNKHRPENFFFWPMYFIDEIKISDPGTDVKRLIRVGLAAFDHETGITLTEKGLSFLEEYKDYVDFFDLASLYVTVTEYEKFKSKSGRNAGFYSVMLVLLGRKRLLYRKKHDYIAVRNIEEDMGDLHLDAGRPAEALLHYLAALYYDASGAEYYEAFSDYAAGNIGLDRLKASRGYADLAPYLIRKIKELKEFYHASFIEKVFSENETKICLCDKGKFAQLVFDLMNGSFDNDKWQNDFRASFYELVKAAEKNKKK